MVNLNLRFIEGSFEYGIKRPKWFFPVLTALSFAGFLICFIPCLIIIISNGSVASDAIGLLILAVLFLIFLVVTLTAALLQYNRFHKKIKKYLNNEIYFLTATPFIFSEEGTWVWKLIRIGVKFVYNGEEITIVSKKFDKMFSKYVDKSVEITYIPEFGQILILKDRSAEN